MFLHKQFIEKDPQLCLERTYDRKGREIGGREPRLVTWVQILFTSCALGILIF